MAIALGAGGGGTEPVKGLATGAARDEGGGGSFEDAGLAANAGAAIAGGGGGSFAEAGLAANTAAGAAGGGGSFADAGFAIGIAAGGGGNGVRAVAFGTFPKGGTSTLAVTAEGENLGPTAGVGNGVRAVPGRGGASVEDGTPGCWSRGMRSREVTEGGDTKGNFDACLISIGAGGGGFAPTLGKLTAGAGITGGGGSGRGAASLTGGGTGWAGLDEAFCE
jgi:hypothetical protein